ncbi:MAG TPA: HlyD family efflux transporter periplasmic adaptor subunit [Thermoanaerobaculia bacterium]|nr:HlyD family efflux transporter periplasmic adaptor subunit [Thermoanaerobaculia bacterium]
MDILRQDRKPPFWRRKWLALPVAGIVIAVLIATSSLGKADSVVDKDRVSIAAVQQGEFLVQVRGAGVLTSKHNQVIAVGVDGNVERIEREAGAEVRRGDVLARISNPKLHEQLSEMRWELEALEKENRAADVVLRSELANLRVDAKNAQSNYELAKMKVEAEQTLLDRGISSRLSFEQTRLAAQQQKERIESAQESVRMMEERLAATRDAHQARVRKMQNGLNAIQQQVDDLLVRAPIDGVVQQMALKLGQAVVKGAEAGRIAPHDNLVAILDIQDYQAGDVRVGQPVQLDTGGKVIRGRVTRIEPTVTNGVVKAEVEILDALPPEMRANQTIEGVIDIERRANALFVTRPQLAKGHARTTVYRVDGDTAIRVPVQFGLVSTRHIEVTSGLKSGDRIIVSDVSTWGSHERVYLK